MTLGIVSKLNVALLLTSLMLVGVAVEAQKAALNPETPTAPDAKTAPLKPLLIDLKAENSTITDILKDLNRTYGLNFVADAFLIADTKANIKVEKMPLNKLLSVVGTAFNREVMTNGKITVLRHRERKALRSGESELKRIFGKAWPTQGEIVVETLRTPIRQLDVPAEESIRMLTLPSKTVSIQAQRVSAMKFAEAFSGKTGYELTFQERLREMRFSVFVKDISPELCMESLTLLLNASQSVKIQQTTAQVLDEENDQSNKMHPTYKLLAMSNKLRDHIANSLTQEQKDKMMTSGLDLNSNKLSPELKNESDAYQKTKRDFFQSLGVSLPDINVKGDFTLNLSSSLYSLPEYLIGITYSDSNGKTVGY